MKAVRLNKQGAIESRPLTSVDVARPIPGSHELYVRVKACGICRTDLHIVEGDLKLPKLPLTPGHQIVGVVEDVGINVKQFTKGDRVGIPWLYSTCGVCEFCTAGRENLCNTAEFTGFHVDGGYAESVVVREDFAYSISLSLSDELTAPLLCAGVIGYRSLQLSRIKPGERIGLYGFGASAHIALQVVRHWGCEAYVFTRNLNHRKLAEELGASWTGTLEASPSHRTESAVVFAPAGEVLHTALKNLRKGGTVVLAGIHMTPIPTMEYCLLYEERSIITAANSTRQDVRELLALAAQIPIRTEVETFPLEEANLALQKLKKSELRGSGALRIE